MKKKVYRVCGNCRKERHTTNTQSPFVCEICLRLTGRRLILQHENLLLEAKKEERRYLFQIFIFLFLFFLLVLLYCLFW